MGGAILRASALLAATAVVVSACGVGGPGDGQDNVITVGLLTSTTGGAAAGYVGTVKAAKARIEKANTEHELGKATIEVVVGDDGSTPAGSLKAAKYLVENSGVDVVLSWSAFTFGSYRYLHREGIPVVGGYHDGPEWGSHDNMFAFEGELDPRYPAPTTWGKIMKTQGVTKLAVIGNNSASADAVDKNRTASAKAVGIEPVYVNSNIPFGSSDFGSPAVAIKNSGADGLYVAMTSDSSFALLSALKRQSVDMKAIVLGTGYGRSLLHNQTALTAAEGAEFYTEFKPVELDDPASTRWEADLRKYADFEGPPTWGVSGGWLSADFLIAGLTKLKGPATAESITKAMSSLTGYTAGGLLPQPRDTSERVTNGMGPGNCVYVVKVKSGKFDPINDGEPFCGTLIPNSFANPDGK